MQRCYEVALIRKLRDMHPDEGVRCKCTLELVRRHRGTLLGLLFILQYFTKDILSSWLRGPGLKSDFYLPFYRFGWDVFPFSFPCPGSLKVMAVSLVWSDKMRNTDPHCWIIQSREESGMKLLDLGYFNHFLQIGRLQKGQFLKESGRAHF